MDKGHDDTAKSQFIKGFLGIADCLVAFHDRIDKPQRKLTVLIYNTVLIETETFHSRYTRLSFSGNRVIANLSYPQVQYSYKV